MSAPRQGLLELEAAPELDDLTRRLAAAAGLPAPPPRPVDRGLDWERWGALAREHDLAPLLSLRGPRPAAEGGASLPALPASVAESLLHDQVRWSHGATFLFAELRRVLALLDEAGPAPVPAVVLKGAALAATLYGEAAARRMSDIDLLFASAAERARAGAVLAGAGYLPLAPPEGAAASSDPATHDWPLRAAVQELTLDLHVDFTRGGLPPAAIADAWARRVPSRALGGRLVTLDPVWQALHVALHALADPVDSPLLRNLLETGWLAARLDDQARAELAAQARRFGIEEPVARALALAHQLFGTPALLGEPGPGPLERWTLRRLEWLRSDEERPWSRLVQAIASRHTGQLHLRPGARGAAPLLGAALEEVGRAVSTRARSAAGSVAALATRGRPLERAPATARSVGDSLLVHVAASGAVHLLRGPAAQAFDLAAAPLPARALVARLTAGGCDPEAAALAVAALEEHGLLAPAAG